MTLIIHTDARTKINAIRNKLHELGLPEHCSTLPALIFEHAFNKFACIDSGDSSRCEGERAAYDLIVFSDPHSSTDLYWQCYKTGTAVVVMDGGFNCHSDWFRKVMAGTMTNAEVYAMARDNGNWLAALKIEWSINT